MKIGDLIYHVDDRADKKSIVGIVLGFNSYNKHNTAYRAKILFTDRDYAEWWPLRELKHVEHNEGW